MHVVYLIQARGELPKIYEEIRGRAILLSYKEETSDTTLFMPESTWTIGRNALRDYVINKYSKRVIPHYCVFLDEDIIMKDGSNFDFEKFERDLKYLNYPVVIPEMWKFSKIECGFNTKLPENIHKYNQFNCKDLYQTVDWFDAAFNAFRYDVFMDSRIFPYDESYEHRSWHISQHITFMKINLYYRNKTIQINDLQVTNTQHSEYPQGPLHFDEVYGNLVKENPGILEVQMSNCLELYDIDFLINLRIGMLGLKGVNKILNWVHFLLKNYKEVNIIDFGCQEMVNTLKGLNLSDKQDIPVHDIIHLMKVHKLGEEYLGNVLFLIVETIDREIEGFEPLCIEGPSGLFYNRGLIDQDLIQIPKFKHHKPLILYSPVRTGSTLMFNFLRELFGDGVIKTHVFPTDDTFKKIKTFTDDIFNTLSFPLKPDEFSMVVTIRHPLDSFASYIRHECKDKDNKQEFDKLLNAIVEWSMKGLADLEKVPDRLVLDYRLFVEDFDYVFDRFEEFFSIEIDTGVRGILKERYNSHNVQAKKIPYKRIDDLKYKFFDGHVSDNYANFGYYKEVFNEDQIKRATEKLQKYIDIYERFTKENSQIKPTEHGEVCEDIICDWNDYSSVVIQDSGLYNSERIIGLHAMPDDPFVHWRKKKPLPKKKPNKGRKPVNKPKDDNRKMVTNKPVSNRLRRNEGNPIKPSEPANVIVYRPVHVKESNVADNGFKLIRQNRKKLVRDN